MYLPDQRCPLRHFFLEPRMCAALLGAGVTESWGLAVEGRRADATGVILTPQDMWRGPEQERRLWSLHFPPHLLTPGRTSGLLTPSSTLTEADSARSSIWVWSALLVGLKLKTRLIDLSGTSGSFLAQGLPDPITGRAGRHLLPLQSRKWAKRGPAVHAASCSRCGGQRRHHLQLIPLHEFCKQPSSSCL